MLSKTKIKGVVNYNTFYAIDQRRVTTPLIGNDLLFISWIKLFRDNKKKMNNNSKIGRKEK